MTEILSETEPFENTGRPTRPSLSQLKAVVEFVQKHPDMAHRKLRYGMSHEKFRKLWIDLSNTANSLNGAMKSTKGWIKFWSDKRRSVLFKHKRISDGKTRDKLTLLEQKILNICTRPTTSRRKIFKKEEYNGGNNYIKVLKGDEIVYEVDSIRIHPSETDKKNMVAMEKMVEVMDQQALAMTELALAALSNSKAMEKIAEASHKQALAVDRLANTFETISGSVFDVRNAIMCIDYTLTRCYSTTTMQQRSNTNLFS